jgi:hypothetical protein
LVLHFFGSKQELFASVVELPFDPETTFDALLAPGEQGHGRRVAEFILGVLDSSEGRKTVTGLIRAAASEEAAAATIRELVAQRLLLPLASRVGRDRPELRASLVASQIVGLAMARHVVGLTPLTTASPRRAHRRPGTSLRPLPHGSARPRAGGRRGGWWSAGGGPVAAVGRRRRTAWDGDGPAGLPSVVGGTPRCGTAPGRPESVHHLFILRVVVGHLPSVASARFGLETMKT